LDEIGGFMDFNKKMIVIMIVALILFIATVTMCASGIERGMERSQKKLVEKKKEFMSQCLADGQTKTECIVLYQDIGIFDDLL